jgi:hypothetical protein
LGHAALVALPILGDLVVALAHLIT